MSLSQNYCNLLAICIITRNIFTISFAYYDVTQIIILQKIKQKIVRFGVKKKTVVLFAREFACRKFTASATSTLPIHAFKNAEKLLIQKNISEACVHQTPQTINIVNVYGIVNQVDMNLKKK
ncbi:hypothetical protein ABFS82_06G066100 [Erythranthe guttata]